MANLWYNPRPEGTPLIEILQTRAENAQARRRVPKSSTRWLTRVGYVYLVYFGIENYFKIGKSVDPETRSQSFGGAELPFEQTLIHVIETDDMTVVEGSLHEYFSSKRIRGEWFKLSEDDVSLIKSFQAVSVHYDAPPETLVEPVGMPKHYAFLPIPPK